MSVSPKKYRRKLRMQESKKTKGLFLLKVITFIGNAYIKEIFTLLHSVLCNIPLGLFIFLMIVCVAILIAIMDVKHSKKEQD